MRWLRVPDSNPVSLEDAYVEIGTPLLAYPRRGKIFFHRHDLAFTSPTDANETLPLPVTYFGDKSEAENRPNVMEGPSTRRRHGRPLQRSYAMSGTTLVPISNLTTNVIPDIGNTSIPSQRKPSNNHHRKPLHLLLQLNSAIRPGLSERDFRALFGKCDCGLIMTRDAFRSHYCTVEETDVIEITDSDVEE